MAKDKIAYVCSHCGQESAKWVGKCPSCGQWNTFKEIRLAPASKAIRNLTFENYPQVSLTVSGGFVPCFSRGFADVKQMLIKVDSLRIEAKQQGKNQIRNMVE